VVALRQVESALDPVELALGQLGRLFPQSERIWGDLKCGRRGTALRGEERPGRDELEGPGEVVRLVRIGRVGEELRVME
jgi:hypothetical protein